jgi:hypothetical protein
MVLWVRGGKTRIERRVEVSVYLLPPLERTF